MKIYMVSLLHRATIRKKQDENITQGDHKYKYIWSALLHKATIKKKDKERNLTVAN